MSECRTCGKFPCTTLFQSLFYWNTSDECDDRVIGRLGAGFQSLFYWNTSDEARTRYCPMRMESCFNPCSIGIPLMSREISRDDAISYIVSILVLLEYL